MTFETVFSSAIRIRTLQFLNIIYFEAEYLQLYMGASVQHMYHTRNVHAYVHTLNIYNIYMHGSYIIYISEYILRGETVVSVYTLNTYIYVCVCVCFEHQKTAKQLFGAVHLGAREHNIKYEDKLYKNKMN